MKSTKHMAFLAILTALLSSCGTNPHQNEVNSVKAGFYIHTDTAYGNIGGREYRLIKLSPPKLTIVCQ